jgi:hypothetical protein
MFVRLALSATIFLLFSCSGTSPEVQVNLTPATALTDTNSSDLIFIVINQPEGDRKLDQNNDGLADTFILPGSCGQTITANCGVSLASAQTVDLGSLPLNYNYSIEARVRNSAGTTLYSGTSMFSNVTPVSPIAITLAAVP